MDTDARLAFWEWVPKRLSGECWRWTGATDKDGYGVYRGRQAHRVAWQAAGLTLDPTLTLDHLCRNRACVNPDHLEQVTRSENTSRANRSRRGDSAHGTQ